jgi:SAM-dependent methyltransferase
MVPSTSPADLAAWNRSLNRTHDMAGWRERGGRIVRAIEERRRDLIATAVRRLRPRTVIDAGCEDGWIAEAYADAVARLFLVDLDPEVLARSTLAGRPGVRTVVADLTAPGALDGFVAPGSADLVVLSAVLEHLPDPASALVALSPCLRPGGRFVIFVPADGPILLAKGILRATGIGGLVRGLSLDPAPGHLHRFDRRRLAARLRPHGTLEEIAFDPAVLGYLAVLRKGA